MIHLGNLQAYSDDLEVESDVRPSATAEVATMEMASRSGSEPQSAVEEEEYSIEYGDDLEV